MARQRNKNTRPPLHQKIGNHEEAVLKLVIDKTWDGQEVKPDAWIEVILGVRKDNLVVSIDAPYHDDAPPPYAPGSTPRLWAYEVVELFILGDNAEYIEMEFGPHGHYLVLSLKGTRNIRRSGITLSYGADIKGNRWTGLAQLPLSYLPIGKKKINAYGISGQDNDRRYLAWQPTYGARPDFHKLEMFKPLPGLETI